MRLRLIPGEPGLEDALGRLAAGYRFAAVRRFRPMTAANLAADFEAWRAEEGLLGAPVRLTISISKGLKVVEDLRGESLYARALKNALSNIPLSPVDFRDLLELAAHISKNA
jgi:hypothetical protein